MAKILAGFIFGNLYMLGWLGIFFIHDVFIPLAVFTNVAFGVVVVLYIITNWENK